MNAGPYKLCLGKILEVPTDQSSRDCAVTMATRFGDFINWAACAGAVLWAISVLLATTDLPHPDWTISAPIAIVGAAAIRGLGLAARYLLGGDRRTNGRGTRADRTPGS